MLKVKTHKKTELENLARMMTKGFEKSDVKLDKKINELALITANGFSELKGEVGKFKGEMDKKFSLVFDDIRLIRADIHDMKNTLGPLVLMMGMSDNEMKKVNLRLLRLEKRVFAN